MTLLAFHRWNQRATMEPHWHSGNPWLYKLQRLRRVELGQVSVSLNAKRFDVFKCFHLAPLSNLWACILRSILWSGALQMILVVYGSSREDVGRRCYYFSFWCICTTYIKIRQPPARDTHLGAADDFPGGRGPQQTHVFWDIVGCLKSCVFSKCIMTSGLLNHVLSILFGV